MSDDSGDGADTKEPGPTFYRKWRAFQDAEHEMRFLKAFAPRDIEKICQSLSGFAELKEAYDFHLLNDAETTLQASFSNRLMFRKTLNDTTAFEKGPSLVYSQGPTGDIVVVLYPPSSELAKVNEKLIFLRMQERSAIKLMDGLKRDLKDLIAYAHVGSIDGDPSWLQNNRIRWLRLTRPTQRDKDYSKVSTHHPVTDLAIAIPKTVATSTVSSLVKLSITALVIAVLGYFGLTELVEMLNL